MTEMLNRHVADRPADRWRGGEEGRAAPRSFVSSSQVQRQRCRQTMMGEEQAGGTSKFRTRGPSSGLDAQVPDSTSSETHIRHPSGAVGRQWDT